MAAFLNKLRNLKKSLFAGNGMSKIVERMDQIIAGGKLKEVIKTCLKTCPHLPKWHGCYFQSDTVRS